MKNLISYLLVALLGIALAGCAGPRFKDGKSTLVVYSDMLNPPFSSWNENEKAVGLEVDLVAEAARRLGVKAEWIERPFVALLPAVEKGLADVAASTIGVTAVRAERVAFSRPYHWTRIVAVVRQGDGEPSRLQDLIGKPVGAGRDTTAEPAARARIRGAALVLDKQDELEFVDMLAQGRIDAMILDEPAAKRMCEESPVPLRILGESLGEERYAFAVAKDSTVLREMLDKVIAERIKKP